MTDSPCDDSIADPSAGATSGTYPSADWALKAVECQKAPDPTRTQEP